jgi:hypothetical protein
LVQVPEVSMSLARVLVALVLVLSMGVTGCAVGPAGQPPLGAPAPAASGANVAQKPIAQPLSGPLPGAPRGLLGVGGNGSPSGPSGSGAPSATATRGTAPENVRAIVQAGVLKSPGSVGGGKLTFTHYGTSDDPNGDPLTRQKLGNRNNRLRSTSLALSPNLIRRFGLKGGEEVWLKSGGREFFVGHYDDTTGSQSRNDVIDVYDPNKRLGNNDFMASVPSGRWELVMRKSTPA